MIQNRESIAPLPERKIKPQRRYRRQGDSSTRIGISSSPGINNSAPLAIQKAPKTHTFKAPQWKTNALHYCLTLNSECGKLVADQYCKSKGYKNSGSSPESGTPPKKTISIKNNQVFENLPGQPTRTFQYITCVNPTQK